MRICYYADGRYIHARRWMRYFAEHGHGMHLISFAEMTPEDAKEFVRIGVKVHGSTGPVHIKKPWRTLSDMRFVRGVLKREKIDILHSHYLGPNAWYGALSRFHPHIITLMGGGDVTGPDWKPDHNVQERFLTPYALRTADHITSWSRFMVDVVRPYCRREMPFDVIHGGIHLERFKPGEKPQHLLERYGLAAEDKVIFSPRLMRPLSNITNIAEAFCNASTHIENLKLLIAAPGHLVDGEYQKEVEQMVRAKSLDANMRFIGALEHDEIADHFRLADVTVSIPDIDGTPMTVLESMACGTPTVIGNLPDYDREYFENDLTTLMVEVKDPTKIADAIVRLLIGDGLRIRITTEARKRVLETGGYEYQMGRMEMIYESLAR